VARRLPGYVLTTGSTAGPPTCHCRSAPKARPRPRCAIARCVETHAFACQATSTIMLHNCCSYADAVSSSAIQTKAHDLHRLCRICCQQALYKIKRSRPVRATARTQDAAPVAFLVDGNHASWAARRAFQRKGHVPDQARVDIACKQNEPKAFTARNNAFSCASAAGPDASRTVAPYRIAC